MTTQERPAGNRMTAIGLLAYWFLNATALPISHDESAAVGRLRFGDAVRLPLDERNALLRLLWWESDTNNEAADERQRGPETWLH